VYTGVCVGTDTNTICAERTAIATMIGATKTYLVHTVVAVWKDEDGAIYVIPPCGHCRQFIADMHTDNIIVTQVILSHDVVVPLSALLPYHNWWTRQPDSTSV
jgi:cytidine deaminase